MGQILYSWAEIREHIADGSYKKRYIVGDVKSLDINLGGKRKTIQMQIAALDTDILFDTYNIAPITWISKDVITYQSMNLTGISRGGWMLSELRKSCTSLYDSILDEDARELIKPARKTSYHSETASSHTTRDLIWIPSMHEVYGTDCGDETGVRYASLFYHDATRKKLDLSGKPAWWWLRSTKPDGCDKFCVVAPNGHHGGNYAFGAHGVVPGFCTAI